MSFQTQVYVEPALAVTGDFASLNPAAVFPAGEGALVAAPAGCTVGAFAWVQADQRSVTNAPPSGSAAAPDGFVHRDLTGQISNFADEACLVIPGGLPVTLFTAGDFWAVTSTAATPGQAVFASTTTGAVSVAQAGSTVDGAVQTRFFAASTCNAGELVKISTWISAV